MKDVYMFGEKFNDSFKYFDNIDEVISFIKDNKCYVANVMDNDSIDKVRTSTMSIFSNAAKEYKKRLIFFDDEHKAFYDRHDNLYVSKEFYKKYKTRINEEITNNLFETDYPYVSKDIYTDELARMLCFNAKTIKFERGIDLPEDIINLYKQNRINAYVEGETGYDEISSSMILGQEYEAVVSNSDSITIYDDITDYENLGYIPDNKKITIQSRNDNYDSMYKIVSMLNSLNKPNKIVVNIKDRESFVKSELFKSDYKFDIKCFELLADYTHDEMKAEEKIYTLISDDINSKNYSPYEKYLACYNITKKFKQYKENFDNKTEARNLKYVLNNEYMVCVGYANMLQELLKRVGISSYHYGVGADTSYDQGFSLEEQGTIYNGHARVIVNITDDKYGVDGYYVADPTWDNYLEDDYYNHALMTFDKTALEDRYMYLSNEDLFMNVKNMDDFSERVNYYITKEMRNRPNTRKGLYEAYNNIYLRIMNVLKALDDASFKYLDEKYHELGKFSSHKIDDYEKVFKDFDTFLTDAANIFINKLGKEVPLDVTIDAAASLNKEVFNFTDEEFEEYKKVLLEVNIARDKEKFPYYYEEKKKKIA